MNLVKILQNRRWERHDRPFPYVYAQGVFTQDFYRSLEAEFNAMLDKGLSEKPAMGRFSRSMPGYDAYGVGFNEELTGNMRVFISPEWHDVMGNLFGVKGTGYINCGAHHHKVGSANGYIHNDFNPVWFPRTGQGRLRHPGHGVCSYKTGAGTLADDQKIEVVRAVVMIYYLANGPWFPGDGGETGFFAGPQGPIDKPVCKIPPFDNSIIMYECTPNSYHSFLRNNRHPRNSIIMWIHRSLEEAVEKWSAEQLERWKL
jgi:hypothetical protein